MWFDFEILSAWNIIINGIPDFIKKENISPVVEWILSDIWSHNFSKSQTLEEVRNKIFAYTACRSAIKFWNKLNLFEMNKLLNDAVSDYSATCPHGRPVIYEIWLQELQDKYER
jgi:DNA mismatch repair protein MutL